MSRITSHLAQLQPRRLDVAAAIGGLVFAVALLPLSLLSTELLVRGIPAAIGLGCLVHLLSVGRLERDTRRFQLETPSLAALPQVIAIGIAALVGIAVVRGGRPLSFLLVAGGVGTLLIVYLLFASPDALSPRLVLVEIVAFAAVVRFAALVTTPGFVGIDTWTHVTSYAAAIQQADSLSALAGIKYVTAPVFHLVTVTAADVLGVSLRTGLYLTVGVAMPLSVLAVYAAATYVVEPRIALLATTLFAVAEYVVEWGIVVSTTSLGLVFFLVVLLLLVRLLYGSATKRDTLVLGSFLVAIAVTHHLTTFVTLVLLGTATVACLVGRRLGRFGDAARGSGSYLPVVFPAYLGLVLSLWAITPWRGERFLFRLVDLAGAWLSSAGFLDVVQPTGSVSGSSTASPLPVYLVAIVDNVGLLLFLTVSVVGSLFLLRDTRSAGTYTLVGGIATMLVLALGPALFGFRLLLPVRWFPFAYALMAIVAAAGLGHIAREFTSRRVVAALLVFALLFPGTMLMAEKATVDSPTFPEQWPTYAYSSSELAAVETIDATVPGAEMPVYTDHPYYTVFVRRNQPPAERRRSAAVVDAYLLPITQRRRASPAYGPNVYREYQSAGRPMFEGPTDRPLAVQLSRSRVCPATRDFLYATDDVLLCERPPGT